MAPFEPGRDQVVGDAGEPSGGYAGHFVQFRATGEEDEFAVEPLAFTGAGEVVEQGIAGRAEVVGQAIRSDGDILCPGGSAGRFCEIARFTGPEHIGFPGFEAFEIRAQRFVVPDRDLPAEVLVGMDFLEAVFFSKGGIGGTCDQGAKNSFLVLYGIGRPVVNRAGDCVCKRPGQKRFYAHIPSGWCTKVFRTVKVGILRGKSG